MGPKFFGVASLQIHVPPTILSSYQVVVSGGGCAGLTAAIAAARTGAKVLLIEKAAFSGGVITNVGLSYFDGMADATTDRIILGGLPLEFLHRMEICGMGATHLDEVDPARAVYKAGAITIRNTEEFKVLADRMIAECSPNLDVLYHTTVCAAETVDGQITSLVVANKSGLVRIEAPVFIDATGDADVARFAGGRVAISESLMPMTLHFRVGDVENSENLRQAVRREVLAAHESGELELFYGPHFGYLFGKNEITVHAVRVRGNGGDPWERSRAEQRARADAWAMFDRWKRNIPEFADAYFLFSGPETGVRESFRIEGMETLTEDDILGQRSYNDGVATGTWYMDLHPNETTIDSANSEPAKWPGVYDIRYGTLVSANLTNLLVAGRCHSATRNAASSSRVTATAMSMGQAVGVAAALCLEKGCAPRELDGAKVSDRLESLNLRSSIRKNNEGRSRTQAADSRLIPS